MATTPKKGLKLTNADLDFWWQQIRLPGNTPAFPTDPTGIRDVKGIGNNIFSPWFGNADQLFPRLTYNTLTATGALQGPYGATYATRGTTIAIAPTNTAANPRYVSNTIASSTPEALKDIGVVTSSDSDIARKQAELAVKDDPSLTPGGRLNPLTGFENPLPASSFMGFFGQFFDHGLDFVHKGDDGTIIIPIADGDPLFNEANGLPFIVSRTNTISVKVGEGSKDTLVTELFGSDIEGQKSYNPVTGAVLDGSSIGGNLILNGRIVTIAAGATNAQVLQAINDAFPDKSIVATLDNSGQLVITPAKGQSVNTVSPFIDLSQSYGSVASHTFFVKEYDQNGNVTGRLVSGGADKDGNGTPDGMATWADIKANAAKIGITLHDYNVEDVPTVRQNADGSMYRDANGQAWLVTTNNVTGAIVYVQDTAKDKLATMGVTLVTTGHAFLDDMAHGVLSSLDSAGDVIDPNKSLLLDAHFIAGDGRANENIGLTSIHEIFHSEHNGVVNSIFDLFQRDATTGELITDASGNYVDEQGRAWSPEDVFQTARAVTEMQYQHLVFAEFARKLSPNINAFGQYNITIDPAITAEFAHAIYRFGHSMMTEEVEMTGVNASGQSSGVDKSVPLLDAFLDPLSYTSSTAAEIALGTSNAVQYMIDEWVNPTLQNNLVGLPLDLPMLNIARGRDSGLPTLNMVRADLFAKTGLTSLKEYASWDDFAQHLLHPESLVNFVLAYATDYLTDTYKTEFTNGTAEERRQFAKDAIADEGFMTATTGLAKDGLNSIDLWLGGLAEAKVPGGMLGSTFDFIFAYQMITLQNADRFYYLGRLAGTDMLGQIDAQLFSDLVMRNTGLTHLYADIFSVADNSIEMSQYAGTPGTKGDTVSTPVKLTTTETQGLQTLTQFLATDKAASFSTLSAKNAFTVTAEDATLQEVQVGLAGFVGNVFYGNSGNYLDARGVLNPNGKGNASEMIAGTSSDDNINSLGGNDTVYGDGGNDTIEGGLGNDFLRGGDGNDTITDAGGDDHIWGDAGDDAINAGVGIDIVFGGDGNDTIIGGTGADAIDGGDGDDTIYGDLTSPSFLDNATGDADAILGGAGNDKIWGGEGADAIDGGDGNDEITGGRGADAMLGGYGDDIFIMDEWEFGVGNTVDGGVGFDTIDYRLASNQTRNGGLTINLGAPGALVVGVGANPPDGILNVESVIGTRFADILMADAAAPTVPGNPPTQVDLLDAQGNPILDAAGNPIAMNFTFEGFGGNDEIWGGAGLADWVSYSLANGGVTVNLNNGTGGGADAGNDAIAFIENIRGSAFADNLRGDAGDNEIDGGVGNDTMNGDTGIDTVSYESAVAALNSVVGVTVNLNTQNNAQQDTGIGGIDRLSNFENVKGTRYNDTLTGLANASSSLWGLDGVDVLNGGSAADFLDGGRGADTMNGGLGNDIYVVDDAGDVVNDTGGTADEVQANLVAYTLADNNGVERLTFIGQSGFTGTGNNLNNVITGGALGDKLYGMAGTDTLNGGDGNDELDGGTGTDTLNGGLGDDRYIVDLNNARNGYTDTLNEAANAGFDTIVLRSGTATGLVALTLANNFEGLDASGITNQNVNITGNGAANILTGNDLVNTISGGGGNDIAYGRGGNDVVNGDAGNDALYGDGGNDALNGGTGNDYLNGGADNDTLNGGAGVDILTGGDGSDTFVFSSLTDIGNNTDVTLLETITDFQSGIDMIDITAIDADPNTAGIQMFTMVNGAFTGTGQMRFNQTDGTLEFNSTGDTAVDQRIRVLTPQSVAPNAPANALVLTPTDFVQAVAITRTTAAAQNEGNGTNSTHSFTVSISTALTQDVYVSYAITGAANQADFVTPMTGVVKIAANSTSATLDIVVVGDTVGEQNENFTVTISNPTADQAQTTPLTGVVASGNATATITNDDLNVVGGATNGNNTLTGTNQADLIDGLGGNDTIDGRGGNDVIFGGAGNDRITGGAGFDQMTGGTGTDRFIFGANVTNIGTVAGQRDMILDYTAGDIIDLSLIDARNANGLANLGNNAFTWIAANANFTALGQLRYDPTTGLLEGNSTGNTGVDFAIDLGVGTQLRQQDVIL